MYGVSIVQLEKLSQPKRYIEGPLRDHLVSTTTTTANILLNYINHTATAVLSAPAPGAADVILKGWS